MCRWKPWPKPETKNAHTHAQLIPNQSWLARGAFPSRIVLIDYTFQLPLGCTDALGMQNYQISNEQITASSEDGDGNHAAFQGRLHFKGTPQISASWSARKNDVNQWLQVDVGSDYAIVTRVATQGRDSAQQWSQWVTKYMLQFSFDSVNFQDYKKQRQSKVSKHTFSQLPPRGITFCTFGSGLVFSALDSWSRGWGFGFWPRSLSCVFGKTLHLHNAFYTDKNGYWQIYCWR